MRAILIFAASAALAGCETVQSTWSSLTGGSKDEPRATAQLKPLGKHKAFGEATFDQVGDCNSPDGMSAKGHFNPFGKPHGHPGGPERHAGDMPALKAGKDGRAKVEIALAKGKKLHDKRESIAKRDQEREQGREG